MHRKLCTGGKFNEACNFGAALAGLDSREDDELAEIELTYLILDDINQARPAFGRPAVCIIRVEFCGNNLSRRMMYEAANRRMPMNSPLQLVGSGGLPRSHTPIFLELCGNA